MTSVVSLLGAIIFLSIVAYLVRNWLRWRGHRLITCPENHRPAGVSIDIGRALWRGDAGLRLKDCSRWPEKKGCGQECLRQIEDAPDGCLLRGVLSQWYAGKDCIYCDKPLGNVEWLHKPAFLSPAGKTIEWHDIHPEEVPAVLATHRPVCWNCHIVETFRREHPELVVERFKYDHHE